MHNLAFLDKKISTSALWVDDFLLKSTFLFLRSPLTTEFFPPCKSGPSTIIFRIKNSLYDHWWPWWSNRGYQGVLIMAVKDSSKLRGSHSAAGFHLILTKLPAGTFPRRSQVCRKLFSSTISFRSPGPETEPDRGSQQTDWLWCMGRGQAQPTPPPSLSGQGPTTSGSSRTQSPGTLSPYHRPKLY